MIDADPLVERLVSGGRLSASEAAALLGERNLLTLGMLADEVRARRHGTSVTFVRVAQVPGDREPPSRIPESAGEVRILGAPATRERAIEIVKAVRAAAGAVPVTGFALDELEALAGPHRGALADLVAQLKDAGLELIASARLDTLRDPPEAARAVHGAGARIAAAGFNALSPDQWLDALGQVVALQEALGVFNALAPLPCRAEASRPSTGYDDVRLVAIARLLVDNIRTIQVDWALYGPKLAQVALTFGANDLDNVSPYDTFDLGARRAPLEEIRRNIRAAGLVPAERNGRFEVKQ